MTFKAVYTSAGSESDMVSPAIVIAWKFPFFNASPKQENNSWSLRSYKMNRLHWFHVTRSRDVQRNFLVVTELLGQGNVFTGVCDSVNRGGVCLSACWDTHTPQSRHPAGADPPRSRHAPSRGRPPEQTPPGADPPGKQTPAYGKQAAGMHPTGMHSCCQ